MEEALVSRVRCVAAAIAAVVLGALPARAQESHRAPRAESRAAAPDHAEAHATAESRVAHHVVTVRDVDPDKLLATAETRPAAARITKLFDSAHGKPVKSVLVALEGPVPPESRPRLLVVAGLEADMVGGVMVAGRLAAAMLDQAAREPASKDLLTRNAVEIIPLVAVDALLSAQHAPLQTWRRNDRPVDGDHDGRMDEDGPDDLDGDGIITSMRIPDPLGAWRISDEDPRLLVKADRRKGEVGAYRIEEEGIDNDGDGQINEDGVGGVDFDRNFPHGWKEFDADTGTSAVSEVETRGLIDHVLETPQIATILVLGRRDNLVKTPGTGKGGSTTPNGLEGDDEPWFADATTAFKKRLGFEHGMDDGADGAFHQWGYYQWAVPSYASKVFEPPKVESPASMPSGKKPESDDAKRLWYSDHRLGGAGFVPWKPFQHPTLGAVEIGGFVPLADLNPTEDLVDGLATKHAAFAFDLLGAFPRAVLRDVEAKALGAGVFEITAVVRNDGATPTVLRMGTRTRTVLPSRVTVEIDPSRFELGDRRTFIEPLQPAGQGRKLRWIVRGTTGEAVAINLWTAKAGSATATVTFPAAPK